MIAIVDYGMGNVRSISNMLKKVGFKSLLTSNIDEIASADKIILPGVGAFGKAMEKLDECNLVSALRSLMLEEKKPTLGICLGMQLLAKCSAEGNVPGLSVVDATVEEFSLDSSLRLPVPHMGWNEVSPSDDLIFGGIESPRFYFVHSFHMMCCDPSQSIGTATYGYEFTCAVRRENVWGVQFHPEKSHKYGMQLLRNFGEM